MSFAADISAALQSLRDIAGVEITYQRGESTSTLTAIPGQTTFQVLSDFNQVIEVRSRDYIFAAADFELDKPRKGDVIIEGTSQYEVMRPDGGTDLWRWSDIAGTVYRVHTKFVGTVTPATGSFSSDFSSAFHGGGA